MSRPGIQLAVAEATETSARVARRVAAARALQISRAGKPNAALTAPEIRDGCMPLAAGIRLLEAAAARLQLSRRACDSVLRLARTVADLAAEASVTAAHVAEALSLRNGGLRTGAG